MTVEEFDRAALFYDRTLALEPAGRRRAARQGARADVSGQARRGHRHRRPAARRALVRRRRALLAGAERKRARAQRRGLDRRRSCRQAAGQRRGAEARRHHRLPPPRTRCVARQVRGVAQAQRQRLRDRASISASCSPNSASGRAPPMSCSKPRSASSAAELGYTERDREDPRLHRSAGAPGAEDRAARAAHRQGSADAGHLVVTTSPSPTYNLARKDEARQFAEKVVRRRAVRRARQRNPVASVEVTASSPLPASSLQLSPAASCILRGCLCQ